MSGLVRANNAGQSGIASNIETIDSDDYVDASIDNAHIGNDQVTGAKLNPSLVLGDIIYADGTDTIARLGKGSEDEVLTMGGSNAPTWAAASGGDVVNDTSPQLGGDLDANGSDITGIGHIGFLASQNASAGANDQDDYEEGTFTPTITFGGNAAGVSYDQQGGIYRKIGSQVTFMYKIALADKGSSTGNVALRSLPFTSSSGGNDEWTVSWDFTNITYDGYISGLIDGGVTTIVVRETPESGTQSGINEGNFADNSNLKVCGWYSV